MTPDNEYHINHEIRIRLLEQIAQDIRTMLRCLIGLALTSIAIPVALHMLRLV